MANSNPGGNFTIDGVMLEEIESEKDSKDSWPNRKCISAQKKAMKSLRVIKMPFRHSTIQTLEPNWSTAFQSVFPQYKQRYQSTRESTETSYKVASRTEILKK